MGLIYETDDRIVTITLSRPDALNAFDPEMLAEFSQALIRFRDDQRAWVCIITGAGSRAFSAGADLKKLLPAIEAGFQMPPTIMRGLSIHKPFIAAVNGAALGGGFEVALACDIRIAAESATFGVPEVRWSLIPAWGGTQRLPRMAPWARASELLLTGGSITAEEAYRMGLVNQIVHTPDLMRAAQEWAERICRNGPLGVRAAKEAMMTGAGLPIDKGLDVELEIFARLMTSEDSKEGPRAFAEKRKPVFRGI